MFGNICNIVEEINMDNLEDSYFNILDDEERALAKALLKDGFITDEILQKFVDFKILRDETGKTYLGEVLINMGVIKEEDVEEYMREHDIQHLEFLEKLAKEGYILEEKLEEFRDMHDTMDVSVVSLLDELDIMTKDHFMKLFNNRFSGFKLGEWLVLKGKVSKEDIEKGREVQKVNSLADYLELNNYCSPDVLSKVKEKIVSAI